MPETQEEKEIEEAPGALFAAAALRRGSANAISGRIAQISTENKALNLGFLGDSPKKWQPAGSRRVWLRGAIPRHLLERRSGRPARFRAARFARFTTLDRTLDPAYYL